jgi:iron(III) transport system substrate-binding protein
MEETAMLPMRWSLAAALLLGGLCAAGPGRAASIEDSLDPLAAAAAKSGTVIWYESSPDDQADEIIAAFNKRFPNVKLQHIRDTGGNSIGARIVQESQGDVRTADVATIGDALFSPLMERHLVLKVDWSRFGVSPELAPSPYEITATAVIYVIVYNTNLVSAADAPNNWTDLLNPRWNGKLGIWVRAEGQGALAAVWGEDKVYDYIKKMNANHPVIEKSTFPLAQQVASGELDVGLGLYHAAQVPLKRGAPIKVVIPEPVPVDMLYNIVPGKAQNPSGGELLALWLDTPEGAKAYEDATDRGNPLVQGTRTRALIQGHTMAQFPPDQYQRAAAIIEQCNKLVESGATE